MEFPRSSTWCMGVGSLPRASVSLIEQLLLRLAALSHAIVKYYLHLLLLLPNPPLLLPPLVPHVRLAALSQLILLNRISSSSFPVHPSSLHSSHQPVLRSLCLPSSPSPSSASCSCFCHSFSSSYSSSLLIPLLLSSPSSYSPTCSRSLYASCRRCSFSSAAAISSSAPRAPPSPSPSPLVLPSPAPPAYSC